MFKNVRKRWSLLPHRQKLLFGLTLVIILTLVIVGAAGGLLRLFTPKEGADQTAESSDTTIVVGSEQAIEDETGEQKNSDDESSNDDQLVELKSSGNGLLEMPVTTDPKEAAAAAAAMLFTVDFGKVTADEYFDTVIERMTNPSPDYVGPNGEIHTRIQIRPFEETVYSRLDPAEIMKAQVHELRNVDLEQNTKTKKLHPWILANGNIFESYQEVEGMKWVATPIEVLGVEEIRAINETLIADWRGAPDIDFEPDTPGATLTQTWVKQSVSGPEYGNTEQKKYHPIKLNIWCDAPEQGGICGVAHLMAGSFPNEWDKHVWEE